MNEPTTRTPPVVRLSGDVARQFAHLPPGEAAEAVAVHLTKYWEPRMLRELVARVRAGEPGIDPRVVAAALDVLSHQVDVHEPSRPSAG